jgi:hypothetical protein
MDKTEYISVFDAGLQTFFAVVLTIVIVGLLAGLIGTVSDKNRLANELKKERERKTNEQKGTAK